MRALSLLALLALACAASPLTNGDGRRRGGTADLRGAAGPDLTTLGCDGLGQACATTSRPTGAASETATAR